jgi:predicted transcriptional regulator
MSTVEENIINMLRTSHGLKAREIANKLNIETRMVNSLLYGTLSSMCYQDRETYRWSLRINQTRPVIQETLAPDKKLSDICKYYLNCLSLEDDNGVSAFLTSKYSLNYTEIDKVGFTDSNTAARDLFRKISNDRNLVAYIGYPVMIYKIHSIKRHIMKPAVIVTHQFG